MTPEYCDRGSRSAATATSTDQVEWVYSIIATPLAAIAAWTAVTGARTSGVWFKICLPVLATSVALLIAASVV